MKKTMLLVLMCLSILAFNAMLPSELMAQKPAEGMYFRLVTHGGDDPFWAVVQKGMRDAVKELGAKADIDLVGGDVALMTKRFQEAVAMRPDGIALVIGENKLFIHLRRNIYCFLALRKTPYIFTSHLSLEILLRKLICISKSSRSHISAVIVKV